MDERGRFLGKAFYGDRSKIALRLITRSSESVDESFLTRRIREAIERRRALAEEGGALRLVFSEGDGLPGLIADRYADWIVVQALIPGMDRRLGAIAEIFRELLKPRGIVCRNDASARSLEGLPLERKMLLGERPETVEVREGPARYLADLWNGHKTGAYLDQRENRAIVGRHAKGAVLDCFSYQGHFALHCAVRAESVTAVESSAEAVALASKNFALNKLSNVTPLEGNAFDLLRLYFREKRRFDTIILDPPPLARKRAHAEDALRGYKEINLRAMHLLNAGGLLATFCCSHGISRDLFAEILRQAAADARCGVRVLEELRQPADHPVLLNVPETAYLKGFVLEKIG
jgi:23S rRNA (cytosine1962-C5)-methyltransferase